MYGGGVKNDTRNWEKGLLDKSFRHLEAGFFRKKIVHNKGRK